MSTSTTKTMIWTDHCRACRGVVTAGIEHKCLSTPAPVPAWLQEEWDDEALIMEMEG